MIFFALAVCLMFRVTPALAQSDDGSTDVSGGYSITDFSADITVNPDSTVTVAENINGNFSEPRHGLIRSVPVDYITDSGSSMSTPLVVLSVTRDGQAEPFTTSPDGNDEDIQIGDPNREITGPFDYVITYRVERVVLFEQSQDELYWNVTGDGWDVPITKSEATIHVAGAAKADLQSVCYTGPQGSTAQDCTLTTTDGEVTASANDLLTVAVRFPASLVTPPSLIQQIGWWLNDHPDAWFWFVPLFTLLYLAIHWARHGRSPKGKGTIIAQYDPPDSLRPAEVVALIHAKADNRAMSSVFVDLAVRGYLKIVEKDVKTLGLFDQHQYSLEKIKTPTDLKPFEQSIFSTAFSGADVKVMQRTDDRMARALQLAMRQVSAGLAAAGYFAADPYATSQKYRGAGAAIGVGGFILATNIGFEQMAFALAITGVLLFLVAPFMCRRTQKGVDAREVALGFKLFLETAERYRLQWQEREGIFEQFLPYAVALGVADKWAKTFEGMNLPAPNWYVGAYGTVFLMSSFTQSLNGFTRFSGAVHAPSARGGGGFGRGGFSGGGFGGGGGRSW